MPEYIYSIKRNRETCSSHLRAFCWIAFPKNAGYFGELVRADPGRCNRFIFPTDRLPKFVGHNPEDADQFPEVFQIFRENRSHPPSSRNIPNISGTVFPKCSKYFGKCYSRNVRNISEKWFGVQLSKYPGYFGKMVRALSEAVVSSR